MRTYSLCSHLSFYEIWTRRAREFSVSEIAGNLPSALPAVLADSLSNRLALGSEVRSNTEQQGPHEVS